MVSATLQRPDPYDEWLDGVNTDHIKPLGDDWKNHPFWADEDAFLDETTDAGKVTKEMSSELTPDERAESCKSSGNDLLKAAKKNKTKQLLREATKKYSEGLKYLLDGSSDNVLLRVALLSNCSQAHIMLENWRNALKCAVAAINFDPKHIKSYVRGAKAAVNLKDWKKASWLCKEGLQLDNVKDLQIYKQRAAEGEKTQAVRAAAEAAKLEARLAPIRNIASCLQSRGYRMTRPQFGFQKNSGALLPWLEEHSGNPVLHFPLMLFYPEGGPSFHDVVEDTSELDAISSHLDMMFGPDAPPIEWDTDKTYTRDRVELFYFSNSGTVMREEQIVQALQGQFPGGYVETGCKRYGEKTSKMVKVDPSWTLGELLAQTDFIMPGIPVLFVVARDTDYMTRFLESFDPSA